MAVAVVAVGLVGACSSNGFRDLDDPGAVSTIPAVTTAAEPDLSGVPLDRVAGATSTTIALGPGPMTIVGVVRGPDGPVADAIVQLERLVGDSVASTRVPTAPDGTWNLAMVLGGRYRIRAWRAPDLVTAEPQAVFIESGPTRSVSLTLELVGGIRVDAAIAPDPPVVDEPANLKVRIAERTVDGEGVVRDTPRSDEAVTLGGSGRWELSSSSTLFTGADGGATFRVTCRESGPQPLFATRDTGESYALVLPPCVERVVTTTTSTRSTTSTSSTSTSTTTEP